MSFNFGKKINISIFGQSHGEAVGIVIDGIKQGFQIDMEAVNEELKRRIPGKNEFSTTRKEDDKPEILSGIFNGFTTGTPIAIIIRNTDTVSKDYYKTKDLIRPSHADYSAYVKYNGFNDYRGGGHFSGRLTAPLVFAGAICKQILEKEGIIIASHIKQIGKIKDDYFNPLDVDDEILKDLKNHTLPLLNKDIKEDMEKEILLHKNDNDSIGGIVEVYVKGLKAGIGEPYFDSIESTISRLAFSVPSVKGIEFGLGFDFANIKGSLANDEFYIQNGQVKTYTNNNGGINGGISNGMPIIYRAVIKPTPSIKKIQRSVNIKTLQNENIEIQGRHDPSIVTRALVVLENVTAIALLDLLNS